MNCRYDAIITARIQDSHDNDHNFTSRVNRRLTILKLMTSASTAFRNLIITLAKPGISGPNGRGAQTGLLEALNNK